MPQMTARSGISHARSAGKHGAWRALEDHYEAMRSRHLRDLFAHDPARGERMTAEAAGVFLDYSKNRIDDETLRLLIALAEQSGLRERSTRCSEVRKSTSLKTGQSSTWRCARRKGRPSWSMARMSCLRSMPCSTRWPPSPTASATANGGATPANAFATSSISVSAVPTSGQ